MKSWHPCSPHLGFDACLATTLERDGEHYTGRIVPPQVIGEGKGEAVRRFAGERGLDLARCLAVGDHITDLPMLDAVGRAIVVAGDGALEQVAAARQWPVLPASPLALEGQLAHV